jgi:hypothetical protein
MLVVPFNDRMIMDGRQFASFFEHTLDPIEILKLVKSKGQFNPSEIDADNVSLYGCIFNVKSTISSEAVTREVITGWELISKNLSVNGIEIEKLFRPTFFYMILDYNTLFRGSTISIDLDIQILLRLCYWYYKSSEIQTFTIKENEVGQKLQGLVEMIQKVTIHAQILT